MSASDAAATDYFALWVPALYLIYLARSDGDDLRLITAVDNDSAQKVRGTSVLLSEEVDSLTELANALEHHNIQALGN